MNYQLVRIPIDSCDFSLGQYTGFERPGTKLKIGDIVTVLFGGGAVSFKVLALPESPRREEASSMYEIIEDTAGADEE